MNIILMEEGEDFFPQPDERCQHIKKVLHLKEGDSFHAGIINSLEGNALITSLSEKGVGFSFTGEKDSSSLYPLTLIVGQTRPICMRRILREAVSLGVERLILPVTEKGEKSYSSSSLYTSGEYKKILLDGAMQAGKTGVSECIIAESPEEALAAVSGTVRLLLDNVIGSVSLSKMDLRGVSVTLAIGPERGWSENERSLFINNGFTPTLIGERILRTETAVSTSTALALSRMGLL